MLLDYGAFGGTRAAYQFSHKVEFTSEWAMYMVGPYGWSESPLGSGITGTFIFSGTYSKVPEYFLSQTNISFLIIEEGVIEIGKEAFYACELLNKVILPSTLNVIGSTAFGCFNLYEIINNSALPISIDSENFWDYGGVAGYARVIIDKNGNKTYKDGYDGFTYIDTPDDFRFIKENDEYKLIAYLGKEETITLPKKFNLNNFSYNYYIYQMKGGTNVIIPDGITEIGSEAFANNNAIRAVYFSDTVTSINNNAFSSCRNLQKVVLSNELTHIGFKAFEGSRALEDLYITENVQQIDEYAFFGCNKLKLRLDSKNNNYFYENGILYNKEKTRIIYCDSSAVNVTIPSSVIDITKLYGNISIKTVTFEKDSRITTIGNGAFSSCLNLERIVLPRSVKKMGSFGSNDLLERIDFEGTIEEWCAIKFTSNYGDGKVRIFDGGGHVGGTKFYVQGKLVTEITLPENINEGAFNGYKYLKKINIPANKKIIEDAFEGCDDLSISLDENNEYFSLQDGILYNKAKTKIILVSNEVRKATILSSVEDIGLAFKNNTKLTSVTFEKGAITKIEADSFSGCSNLISVSLPDSITAIADGAFSGCNLRSITIPANVTFIGNSAFAANTSLYEIINNSDLPLTLGSWDYGQIALYTRVIVDKNGNKTYKDGDEGFLYIETPENFRFKKEKDQYVLVDYLGDEETVVLPSALTIDGIEYEYIIRELRDVKNVIIPNGFTYINSGAFYGCVSLKSVTLPYGLKQIESGAFWGCSNLKKIELPESVTWVSYSAFAMCSNLNDIVICGTDKIIASNAFNGTGYYNNPDNWQDGVLYCGDYALAVQNDLVRVDVSRAKNIGSAAFEEAKKLTHATIGKANFPVLQGATNIETLVITELPEHIYNYFTGGSSSDIPMTLKNIVLKNGCDVQNNQLFNLIKGVKIYVERDKSDCAWDTEYPGWNNGNRVYYAGEWINAVFSENGKVVSDEYYSIARVVRQPVMSDYTDEKYYYTFIGWDTDNDGLVDGIGATSAKNIYANALFKQEFRCVKEGHSGGRATCTKKAVCQYCGEEYGNFLGHNFVHYEGKAATCTEKGWSEYDICTCCGYTTFKELEAKGHKASATVEENRVEATCTEDGHYESVVYCSVCEKELNREKKTIKALGEHNYLHHEGKAATCIEYGWEEYDTCMRCNYTTYKEIAAFGHNYVHHIGKSATCTETGWKEYDTCTRCDYSTYEKLAAKGHTEIIDRAVAATCTKTGLTEGKHCSECSAILVAQRTTEALGHDYGEWTTIEKPTETDKGTEERVCKRCDHRDQRSVPELKDVAAFKAAVSDLSGKKNEALFTAIKTAVELYNSLSDENRELVEKEYAELKSAIATYNEIVSAQNEAFAEANETALGLLVARLTVLAAMIYLLKRKLL